MRQVILFVITYVIVFLIYQLFIVRKAKRRNSKKRPMEVNYLISKYNIDIKKVDYSRLLLNISLVSSLDITILVTLVTVIKNYVITIILATILMVPIIIVSYGFLGKYYVKKGMIKDE